MLKLNDYVSWGRFYVSVHETGNDYYGHINNQAYCPDNAEGAAKFINDRLREGAWASKKNSFTNNGRNWTANVFCSIDNNKSWSIATTIPSPPDSANCTITHPATVSFGDVTLGARKDINAAVNISCDKVAYLNISLSKQTVRLGDAVVNYYFPDNKKKYSIRASENGPASFNMRFSLENTGNTLGYKSGDAVMIFNWQ